MSAPVLAQPQPAETEVRWATGNDLQRQLAQQVEITWREVPLRDALDRLAQLYRTAIFLDRRVDPELRISLETAGATVRRTLEQLADGLGLGIAHVGPVIYVGPPYVCDRLATLTVKLRGEVQFMDVENRRVWRRRTPWGWPRLAEPRQILADLAQAHELQIENAAVLPHDLWRRESLPPMTLPEKLTLLLAGFQLSYELSENGTVLLTRFPPAVAIKRRYRLPNDASLPDRIRREFPQAHLEIEGREMVVESTIEDHWRLAEMLGGGAPSDSHTDPISSAATAERDDSNQRYTLKIVNQPRGAVIQAIGKKLDLQIEFSGDIQAESVELISLSVDQVSLDELLDTILKPANLAHQRTRTKLRIFPATE